MKKFILGSFLLSITLVSFGTSTEAPSQKAKLINFIGELMDKEAKDDTDFEANHAAIQQLLEEKLQLFIEQQGDLNQTFILKDLLLNKINIGNELFGVYLSEGDVAYTLLSFCSWSPVLVATLLKYGAKPVVGEISALDGWVKTYVRFTQDRGFMSEAMEKRWLENGLKALGLLFDASDKKEQKAFFKKIF